MDFQPWLSLVASYGQSCLAQRGKVITVSFICASNIQGATIPGQPIFHATTVVLATTRWNCWFVGMWILTLLEVTHDPTRNTRQTTFPERHTQKKQQPFCWNRVSGMLGPSFFDVKFCLHIGLKLLALQTMWKMAAQVKVVYLPAAVFRRK